MMCNNSEYVVEVVFEDQNGNIYKGPTLPVICDSPKEGIPFCDVEQCNCWTDSLDDCCGFETSFECSVDHSCVNCDEDCVHAGEEDLAYGIPDVDHIIYAEPHTIVYWEDGTKTVVRCGDGEKFERYAGFMAAVCKKMFGSTSNAMKLMNMCDINVQRQKEKEAARIAKEKEREQMEAKKAEEVKVALEKFENDVIMKIYQLGVEAEADRRIKLEKEKRAKK